MVIYKCLDLLPSNLISVCYAQAITNGYAAGIGPSPFFPRLAEIWIWEKMVNMYVGKFKLNCSHYFQFRRN